MGKRNDESEILTRLEAEKCIQIWPEKIHAPNITGKIQSTL
jgi:hypothetical protein